MADGSHIEWTDATWNIVTGCSVVSPGCTNCYAMKLAGTRLRDHPSRQGLTVASKAGPVWNGQVRFNAQWLDQPLRWTKPRRIFVAAHGDLFHDGVTDDQLAQIFGVMVAAVHLRGHTFQVLTKRSARMREVLSREEFWDQVNAEAAAEVMERTDPLSRRTDDARATLREYGPKRPPPGIWIGVSVEDQTRADERVLDLVNTPAAVRWISAEPLLGPVKLPRVDFHCDLCGGTGMLARWPKGRCHHCKGRGSIPAISTDPKFGTPSTPMRSIDWVVAGGESGAGARPMHPDWARQLRAQCAAADIPFLFKQWGDWGPVCELDIDALDNRLYHPPPKRDPEGRRRPRVPNTVLHADGNRFDRPGDLNAYAAGKGAMLMFQVGKATTGRLLDGVLHDAFPTTSERAG